MTTCCAFSQQRVTGTGAGSKTPYEQQWQPSWRRRLGTSSASRSSRHHSATVTCSPNGQPSLLSAPGLSLTRTFATKRQKHSRAALCSLQDHTQDAHSQGGLVSLQAGSLSFPAPTQLAQLARYRLGVVGDAASWAPAMVVGIYTVTCSRRVELPGCFVTGCLQLCLA